jgi:hypothetical protein
VTTAGVVTATGSITVNGVKYETNGATVAKEGAPLDTTVLTEGMVVTVHGRRETGAVVGTAEAVEIVVSLRGTLTAVGQGEIEILGQRVTIDEDTVLDNGTNDLELSEFTIGNFVEISGIVLPQGGLVASRVQLLNQPPATPKTTGLACNPLPGSFQIGDLTVHYEADDLVGFNGPVPQADDYVEVRGTLSAPLQLIADRVEKLNGPQADRENLELEGNLLDRGGDLEIISPVGKVPLRITPQTQYSGGTTADLTNGRRLLAAGDFRGGILTVRTVLFAEKIQLWAAAQSADSNTGRIGLRNLPGMDIQTDGRTLFLEKRPEMPNKPTFPEVLNTLTNAEWLWIKGRLNSPGVLTATKIRIDAGPVTDGRTEMMAPVDASSSGPDLQILGLIVHTVPATEFYDTDGNAIASDPFFTVLSAGTKVKVLGTTTAVDTITAQQISLED